MNTTIRFTLVISYLIFFITFCKTNSKKFVVTLDSYFNNEHRRNKHGTNESYHYKWQEFDDGGFSKLSGIFEQYNAITNTLYVEPSRQDLINSSVYIIVDPDTKLENPKPNYILTKDITVISEWVRDGGTLVLMANDKNNTELSHLNGLAAVFGIHFNYDVVLHVTDDNHLKDGEIITKGSKVFKSQANIFIKDACSISVSRGAKAVLYKGNSIIIAETRYSKGKIIAVGDPWLYNEYLNGRLPKDFDNKAAAADFVQLILNR